MNVTQKQENVNEALKTICCLLDATPWELGVLSTSKGLIAGPLQIHLPDNVVIDCGIDRNGIYSIARKYSKIPNDFLPFHLFLQAYFYRI